MADDELLAALTRLGVVQPGEKPALVALGGGVSSDIWKAETQRGSFCVKRALPKLKVVADWHAPIERNVYEAAWMRVAASVVPDAVPELIGQDEKSGVLAMAYLAPERFPLWKDQLRQGQAKVEAAEAVGDRLVRIHAFAARTPGLAEQFKTDEIFYDIRLEPYLVATGQKHPAIAPAMNDLVETTAKTKLSLVHGDVSPKNILMGEKGPVFLDAECAWFGDPAFDLAFCLNHLLLKCIWVPAAAPRFLACFEAVVSRYLAGVDWEPARQLEARVAALLPGLLLGRIDGKSPVEYITRDEDKDRVRRFAIKWLETPASTLAELASGWADDVVDATSKPQAEGGED